MNDPRLHLTAEDIPSRDELRFEGSKETGLWYAEHSSGKVEYFAWSGGQQDGYAGRHYTIQTVADEEVTLKGPWSSRAGVFNKRGYGPCMDVIYESPEDHVTGTGGSITVERASEAVDEYLEDVELEKTIKFESEEPYWIPTKRD